MGATISPGKVYQTISDVKRAQPPDNKLPSKSPKIVFVSGSTTGNDGWSSSTARLLSKLAKVLPTTSYPTLSLTEDEIHGHPPPAIVLQAVAEERALEQQAKDSQLSHHASNHN